MDQIKNKLLPDTHMEIEKQNSWVVYLFKSNYHSYLYVQTLWKIRLYYIIIMYSISLL